MYPESPFHDHVRRDVSPKGAFGVHMRWVACLLVFLLLCGCRTRVQVVEVERIRTEYQREASHERDSIHQLDSVRLSQRGDTVYLERWRTKTREIRRIDTLYLDRTDSVVEKSTAVEPPRQGRGSFLSRLRTGLELWLYRIALVLLALLCLRLWIGRCTRGGEPFFPRSRK